MGIGYRQRIMSKWEDHVTQHRVQQQPEHVLDGVISLHKRASHWQKQP